MIERRIKQQVMDALDRQAAVALIGPRQVGKTTLAQEIGEERRALYLDLEDRDDREKLSNAALFLKQYEDRLVVLDEIHRVPELFQTLRGIIDQGRRKGKRTGRFLILGSASIDLLRQSGESLAGRIEYVDMQPLDVTEVGTEEDVLNRLWIQGGGSGQLSGQKRSRQFKAAQKLCPYLSGKGCSAVWATDSGGNTGAVMDDARAWAGDNAERFASCVRVVTDSADSHKIH